MLIHGLQKLTLLDYPGKVACTVFTGGCNFRCPFCHNGSLVLRPDEGEHIPEEELFALLKKRQGVLEGVCITGGEPTLAFGLETLMARIKEMGYLVKLDTNGTRPKAVKRIIDAGLADMIAMDIKNSYKKYPETCGVPGYDTAPVKESIQLIMSSGIDYEFRTTVMREFHTPDDIRAIA
ncbi:MAG: anaerobic ribonucleoside-triphosphate reductase activating protein, partial [Eubacteriales bacterium]|nr:anaerobic ribonucleoside-triphosphate reductase activating protein [Clostridiales bacterium]MDY5710364.1 anaerobic ribonucleoside-triphosphate reductase activating protein [Eubacteriales bacterium]